MKAYTDIEQSRKLAEILPVESADMCWCKIYDENHMMSDYRVELIPYRFCSGIGVPCWSLAALLKVLPHRINDTHKLKLGKLYTNNGWYVCYDDDGDIDLYVNNSNLIDACVEMILKLKENNLL